MRIKPGAEKNEEADVNRADDLRGQSRVKRNRYLKD